MQTSTLSVPCHTWVRLKGTGRFEMRWRFLVKSEGAVEVQLFLSCFKAVTTVLAQVDREKIYQWINELSSPETRENALLELSKKSLYLTWLPCCGTPVAPLQSCCKCVVKHVSELSLCVFFSEIVSDNQKFIFIFISARKLSTSTILINQPPPPTLTAHQSNRVCNALALLQCVAFHPETR